MNYKPNPRNWSKLPASSYYKMASFQLASKPLLSELNKQKPGSHQALLSNIKKTQDSPLRTQDFTNLLLHIQLIKQQLKRPMSLPPEGDLRPEGVQHPAAHTRAKGRYAVL
jgi:hypothetical protein